MKKTTPYFIILGILFTSCAPPIQVTRSRLMMGHVPVNISIRTSNQNEEKALQASEEAYTLAQKLENKLSEYNSSSEISCLNQKAGKDFCTLSEETVRLLNLAQEINQKTEGAFDIRFPSLSEAGKKGMILLLVNEGKLANSQTRIGIASLAKGYILDQMVELLQTKGFEALVDAGGDIRASGGPWKVAIQIPGEDYGKNTSVFKIKDQALTTSGNYENEKNIVDPKTSKPIQSKNAVSVIATNATLANALSTALYVLGSSGNKIIHQNFSDIQIFWVNERGKIKKD